MNQGNPHPLPGDPGERVSDEWTPLESRALALWQAPEPPAGFEQRLLARARTERAAGAPAMRTMAVAAAALVLVGGLVSVRAMLGRPGSGFESPAAGFATPDAGPRPEVRAPFDGIEGIEEAQAS